VGKISSEVLERYDLRTENAFLFELDIITLLEKIPEGKDFEPFARFPAVFRDISLVIEGRMDSLRIQEIIKSEGGELVESVNLFDLYEGGNIDSSEKALALRICYRSKEGTLDGREINLLHEAIIDKIRQKAGGRLREG
jgi:phenylalanyl-tRNA synthetase beta chain